MANVHEKLSAVLRERVILYRAKRAYQSHVQRLVRPIPSIAAVTIDITDSELSGAALIASQLRRYWRQENAE